MTAYKTQPPWEFLLSASRNSLASYELSRLNHAANLRKEITALIDQWIEENSSAMLARWLMEQRERSLHAPDPLAAGDGRSGNASGVAPRVSDNFLPDQTVSPPANRGQA